MSHLILIRHSISEPDTSVPAAQWRLSHRGRQLCQPLAQQLAPHTPTLLVSSMEPKAIETARLTAAHLKLPSLIAAGLHEHDRSNVGFFPSKDQFDAAVQQMFAQPSQCVFGLESADQARLRFTAALEALLADHPEEALAVVTHGTVLSLFAAHANLTDPLPLWQSLSMPAFVVLQLPGFALLGTIPAVAPPPQ
ncbi:MAG: phosphoglycerate mutase family protein [Anaerolineae bacterium]|nr:phosphoglycerate mutase family protein [Anaerolineae bacterium]